MSKKIIDTFNELEETKKQKITKLFEEFLVDPKWTYSSLAEEINSITNWKLNRKGVSRFRVQLGYPERSKDLIDETRALQIKKSKQEKTSKIVSDLCDKMLEKHSVEDIKELYLNTSLTKISEEFSSDSYYMRMALTNLKIDIKDLPSTFYDLIDELKERNYKKEDIEVMYLDKDMSFVGFVEKINSIVDREVTEKQCYKLLSYWNVRKSSEDMAYRRATKSRGEFSESLNRLKKSGFNSREELAKHYEENNSITKSEIVTYLNSFLEDHERVFTIRWLERHMDPFLSEDRLKGVSRVELSLQKYLSSITSINEHEIRFNDRSVITPYELDMYIPSLSVAIELNGNYWHSDKFLLENHNMTSHEYHTMKKLMCQDKGIKLLFVWELDWENYREEIQEALVSYFDFGIIKNILKKYSYEDQTIEELNSTMLKTKTSLNAKKHNSAEITALKKYFSSLGFSVETNVESVVSPYKLDIYIPEKNIAIDFNKLIWQSEKRGNTKYSHYNKWKECKEKGIQLITIWEDDYEDNPELFKKMISHKLGISDKDKVYARKTEIKQIDLDKAKEFYRNNHMQGFKSGHHFGLVEENTGQLVALSTWSKNTKNKIVNLDRFATSCVVPGGFSKLLKYAVNNFKEEGFNQIVTFASHEVSNGQLYENNGFILDKELRPDYSYVWKGERKHKFGFRLKRFKNDPDLEYIENHTEKQLAELNGIPRIWDYGKTRYVMTL